MGSIETTPKMTFRWPRRSAIVGAVSVLSLVFGTPNAGAHPFPKRIALPNGFQPEGIAISHGNTFFVGSIPTGAIVQGDLRTGETFELVPPQTGRRAIGMKEHRGVLFVAGGPTGQAYAYDANTGEQLETFQLAQPPSSASFVNDVVVTRDAAFFTDSVQQQIYRVPIGPNGELGVPQIIPLKGRDIVFDPLAFNVNGIDATPNGKTLIIVQSNTGFLFTVDLSLDPATGADNTKKIDLGGQNVVNGDGILLDGSRLWVVQNQNEQLTLIRLQPDLSTGTVEGRFTDESFDIPTTAARKGSRIILVNARFGTASPEKAEYWLTQIQRPKRDTLNHEGGSNQERP